MAKRARILTADNVTHKFDGDEYFLEVNDLQDPVNKLVY